MMTPQQMTMTPPVDGELISQRRRYGYLNLVLESAHATLKARDLIQPFNGVLGVQP